MKRSSAIVDFWFGSPPHRSRSEWFTKNAGFDQRVRDRFHADYVAAAAGELKGWLSSADGSLAYTILLDQFPRNMFRGTPRAFAADDLALAAARSSIDRGFDHALSPLQRAFVYLPFEHSENLADQQRAVELFEGLRGDAEAAGMVDYARRHRDVIARFGRFPHRNAILGRASTPEEQAFLRKPGSSF